MTPPPDDIVRTLADLRARVAALESNHGGAPTPSSAPGSSSAAPASGKELGDAIDRMVADALLNGRHTTGVLQGLFNLAPGLSGR